MSALLTGIGTQIAERWLQTVVLAGLLWIAALVIAVRLGHGHPFDVGRLSTWLDEIAREQAGQSTSAVLLAVVGALLAAGAAGLAAGALGGALQRLWGASGAGPPLSWVLRRGGRLLRAYARHTVRRRTAQPERPTRIGDTFHGVAVRVHRRYALDLEPTWPRLWALLPETLRADVLSARQAYDSAARLAGWALLYAALAVLWWPAALAAAAVLATAVSRARDAANLLAVLVETAVDLHLTDLAERLGVRGGEDVSATELGQAVAHRLAGHEHPAGR